MSRKYNRYDDVDDGLLIEICQRFLRGETRVKTAKWLTKVLGRTFTREAVYREIARAVRLGYIRLDPPPNLKLQLGIADRFKQTREEIHVIDAQGATARDLVAAAAARHVVRLIDEVSRTKERVCIGLGGGGTVDRVAHSLAKDLRKRFDLPPLALHALTPGFDVFRPRTAPVSSFGYFAGIDTHIDQVGLFAPAVVPAETYEEVTSRRGIVESFDRAHEIDIVITSCARAADKHGELNRFMQVASHDDGDRTEDILREAGWVADVTYRPYSELGPIVLDHDFRGVTLFELEDLVKLVREEKNKHVVLVAAPCGQCHEPKVEALLPLLTQPETLKLWNHLFLDTKTAMGLMTAESNS